MFSESTAKQLQLIGGIVSPVLGIIISLSDFINKVPGLPRNTSWVLGGAIFLFGIKPFLHGVIAGNVLHNVLDLIACDPGNASLGKAIEMALPAAGQLS